MADTPSVQPPEPELPAAPTPAPVATSVALFADQQRTTALVASNATVPPKQFSVFVLPQLPTQVRVAYRNDKKFDLTVCTVGSREMEMYTAYDWLMMSYAAAKAGIHLRITSAWRSYEEQERLRNERHNPDGTLTEVGRKKGPAGKPGRGPHQLGTALDIGMGLAYGEYETGKTTDSFEWMLKNAPKFGFTWTGGDIKPLSEPWHWVHTATSAVGSVDFEALTGFAVMTAETAAQAARKDQNNLITWVHLTAHSDNAALARDKASSRTPRQKLASEQAVFSAHRSAALRNKVSETSRGVSYTPPASFEQSTIAPYSYDFTTGRWGDGKPV